MKVITNSKQVLPKDVKKSYYAADLFLNKVLDAILLEAGCRKLGIKDVSADHSLEVEQGKARLQFYLSEINISAVIIVLARIHSL